jgi:hypothetical protein
MTRSKKQCCLWGLKKTRSEVYPGAARTRAAPVPTAVFGRVTESIMIMITWKVVKKASKVYEAIEHRSGKDARTGSRINDEATGGRVTGSLEVIHGFLWEKGLRPTRLGITDREALEEMWW